MPKKTRRPRRSPASATPPAPPAMGRLAMDQTLASLQKLLAGQDFTSIEEANAFLQQTLQANGGQLPAMAPETPLEQAQALVAQAYEARTPARQRALARQALDLSPDCADAYLLLAELAPMALDELALLEQAVAAGRRALGAQRFEELQGDFWGLVETRPFMRATAGLAQLTWGLGDRARAIKLFQELLQLNPRDNQGIRYLLATAYLEERTPAAQQAVQALFDQFPEDGAANWAYNRALWWFQRQTPPAEPANQALQAALQVNPHVPGLLLGEQALPADLPQFIGMGDASEAAEYVAFAADAWRHTSGALFWLRQQRA